MCSSDLMPLLPGYQQSPNMSTGGTVANPSGGCCSLNPDANIDNDNNLVRREGPNGVGGILYTNFITLTKGQEPTTDGDGSDGNFTMDMAQCGTSFIGDFVWNDLNSNGIQDTGEPGINGVFVNILFSDGTTASTTTINFNGRDGYYDFKNLGPGVHKISFVAPTGLYFTKANQGSDDGKDSDPVNGSPVTVTLVANQSDFTIDAGFSTTQPPPPPPDCTYSSNGSGYYGGFEAGSGNFPAGTGSDLYNGLPRNGSYQVVQNVNQLGGGGYLNIQPRSGSWFLASHTSNNSTERIWYSKFAVTPGQKYSFCAAVTLLKNLGNGAVFLVGVYANGVQIGEGRVGFNWTNICGDFTVPAGVTTLEFSIRDPKKGLFFLAIDDICITKTSAFKQALALTADVADTKNAVSIYPNPTTRFAKLNISTVKAATAEVRIINMTGNVVYRVTKKLNIGYNSISLNNLPEYGVGLYQVQVIMEDKVYNQQLLITK